MKISFIVAACNIETYVQECLESIALCASLHDEIIVIDDGSTDATGSIARKIACSNENMVVYKKNNGGLSSARNSGLNKASGDYVLFLDGDDTLIPEAFTAIRNHLKSNQPDILITDHLNWLNDGIGPAVPSQPRTHKPYIICTDNRENLLSTLNDCIPRVWTRIIRRELFNKLAQNPFDERIMYDDLPLTPHITAEANSLLYVPLPMVKYRARPNSITKLRNHRSCTDMVAAAAQATKATARLPFDSKLALTADIMLARKTMEAIRQCREVQNPSYGLYAEIINRATSNLSNSPLFLIVHLLRSTTKRDHRIAKHFLFAIILKKIYIFSQLAKAKISATQR